MEAEEAHVKTSEVGREVGLSHRLFDELRDQIIEGTYRPGARLPVDAIRSQFGVSKQPVMEALRRLEALGLVQITPQSGCRVRQYGWEEAKDFFRVFASFEGEIAAAAAQRHDTGDLADLERALAQLHEVEEADDLGDRSRAYFIQNAIFHRVVHTMSRSPLVTELSQRMWYLSDHLMYEYAGVQGIAAAVIDRNHDHDLILASIRSRNDVVAKAAMEEHVRSITRLFTPLSEDDHPPSIELPADVKQRCRSRGGNRASPGSG